MLIAYQWKGGRGECVRVCPHPMSKQSGNEWSDPGRRWMLDTHPPLADVKTTTGNNSKVNQAGRGLLRTSDRPMLNRQS